MKLLFDENLAERLAKSLADLFVGSAHVRDVGLKGADDRVIWDYARAERFAIVTKDDDFREMSVLLGAPPKLIILRTGNSPTREAELALRQACGELERFDRDAVASIFEIV